MTTNTDVTQGAMERAALQDLLDWAEAQICVHEETHRAGLVWEICDQCGAKWADDEGGKPEFQWPKPIAEARASLARYVNPHVGQPAASAEPTERVLIDGVAYTIPAPVAAELLRLHVELLQTAPVAQEPADWRSEIDTIANNIGEALTGATEQGIVDAISPYVDQLFALIRQPLAVSQDPAGTVRWRGSPYPSPVVDWIGRPPESGTPIYAVPVAAQAQPAMPALTEAMRAVLRNEHDVYGSEDDLYAALCDAAEQRPVVNQQMTTEPSAQDREDAQHPEWMTDEGRAPWAINSLKDRIKEMRASEKRCRNAFRKDYMRVVSVYFADALDEAAKAFEKRLAAIDAARAAKGE